MKLKSLVAVLALFLVTGSSRAEGAEWTFMLYWAGDNNLEFRVVNNLVSMMEFGSDENVNLIVFADRNPKGEDQRGFTNADVANIENWDGAKIFRVERGSLTEVADLGEVNDGDPAVLQNFVATSMRRFPAKKYALILRNHGGGWQGACWDDADNHDFISLPELTAVLEATKPSSGQFDLVGFDMCLNANLEVASAVAPYAKFMSASEDLAYGSNYSRVMRRFFADPSVGGDGLARAYVDAYYDEHGARGVATYSAVDLAKVPALEESVDALADALKAALAADPETGWLLLAEAQAACNEFGTNAEGASNGYHLYDIVELCGGIKTHFTGTPVAAKANAVLQAADAAIVHNRNGADRPHSNGLSIFLPNASGRALTNYANIPFSSQSRWPALVSAFAGAADADVTRPVLSAITSSSDILEGGGSTTLAARIGSPDVSEAFFTLAYSGDGEEIVMGTLPVSAQNGALSTRWSGGWFTIEDKDKALICPADEWDVIDAANGVYSIEVPVEVKVAGSNEWEFVTLIFRLDINADGVTGRFESAWGYTSSAPYEFDLTTGDSIRPVYLVYDAEGEESWRPAPSAGSVLTYDETEGLTIGYGRVPAGTYFVGFTATDYSDNTGEVYTSIEVK